MADGIAFVADGIATFFMTDVIVIMEMEKPFCVTADVSTVAEGTVTLYRWLMWLPLWQMELPHVLNKSIGVAVGIASYVLADVIANCGRWNNHMCDGWCYYHLWQME